MRFIHTADWQIGMKTEGIGKAGEIVRKERISAVERIVKVANEKSVDFIIVAGDLFEDNGVERVVVQKIGDILSKFGGPVFIIPGNHDPASPGSVWEHPVWNSHDNLHVLLNAEPVEHKNCILYPCPVLEKYSTSKPISWIKADQPSYIQIGIAHGTVEGIHQEEPDYPISRNAPIECGLDYLALGHWHSTTLYEENNTVRMAYSGTHETSRFGERDSGNILFVEITHPGATPQITKIRTGKLIWKSIKKEIRLDGELSTFRKEIESTDFSDITLLDIALSGVFKPDDEDEIERLKEILESRFLYYRLDRSGLLPSPEDDAWLHLLPEGVIRETASRLKEMATSGTIAIDNETSSEIATQALIELYAIAMKGRL